MALKEAMGVEVEINQFAQDLDIHARTAKRVPLISKLRETDPEILLPSTKDHRIVPVAAALKRTSKEVLMLEKKLMRELERVTAQEEMMLQEREWMKAQQASTKAFLNSVLLCPKMREEYLKPAPGSSAIIRDSLQKQLLVQKQELKKSLAAYEDEMIGINISCKDLADAKAKLLKEVKSKDEALTTDTAALHLSPTGGVKSAPPNKKPPLLQPRSSWLKRSAELLEDSAVIFKNATRKQVKSASVRRSRGIVDENFRLKLNEMLQRMAIKSTLTRPYLEQRLIDVRAEIVKADDTVTHLAESVEELKPSMDRAELQQTMRNQRPQSEFVDDSGSRALQMERQRWEASMGKQKSSLAQVRHDHAKLRELEAALLGMLENDSGSLDTDNQVLKMQTEASPIPPALLETCSPKKNAITRGGSSPSVHHIFSSYRLPDKSVGMRSVSAMSSVKYPSSMPRLQKHVTMTSNLMDSAPPGFWSPPKGLSPPLPKRNNSPSKTHHVSPLDSPGEKPVFAQ